MQSTLCLLGNTPVHGQVAASFTALLIIAALNSPISLDIVHLKMFRAVTLVRLAAPRLPGACLPANSLLLAKRSGTLPNSTGVDLVKSRDIL